MDLLVIDPADGVVDLYKKPEILFMGPDENTADLMEWAANFSKGRSMNLDRDWDWDGWIGSVFVSGFWIRNSAF
jgi:glutamate dehydrogenase